MNDTRKVIRIGGGGGFADDRIDAAVELIEKGNLDYLSFDALSENELSQVAMKKLNDPSHPGYDRMLEYRMERMECAGGVVQITTSTYDCEEYKGILEKIIPEILQPSENDEDIVFIKAEENNVPVEDGYEYPIGTSEGLAYGINSNGKWRKSNWSGSDESGYYSELGLQPEAKGEYRGLHITVLSEYHPDMLYYHYFSDSDQFGVFRYGKVLSKEETEPLETPFGKAKYLYVQTEMDGETYEEEVALLNNNGINVIFHFDGMSYFDGTHIPYDGTCDRYLESILETLK